MDFRVEHVVDATLARLEAAILAPEHAAHLPEHMPLIAHAELIESRREGDVVVRAVRFRPSMKPPAFAKGITSEMTEWVEHSRWNLLTHVCEYRIQPNLPPAWTKYFEGHGRYRLEARGLRTARVVEGVLNIHVAVVGGIAERLVVGNLKKQFEGEARLLAARVQSTV